MHGVVLLVRLATTHAIVVASPFDREIDMVSIKIDESTPVASRIVLCESNVTQSGYPRAHKLKIINSMFPFVETCTTSCSNTRKDYELGWECENAPRAAAQELACKNEPNTTVVVLSDADEIVSGATLESIKQMPPPTGIRFLFSRTMAVYMYGFFWQRPNAHYSTATAQTCGTLRSTQRTRDVQYPRFSGWHCSYCFPVDEYWSKMHSMLKGDGWLSLSDHYWSTETIWSFRQHGIPLNGREKLSQATVLPPVHARNYSYLIRNTNMNLPHPLHPFTFPK
jgi:hypothetical protein